MSIIAEWKIKGNSNRQYTFDVYSKDGKLPSYSGVYILSKRTQNDDGSGSHDILYIGTAKSISGRVKNTHEKWETAIRKGMNAISVYPANHEIRNVIEDDLIDKFNPPLNKIDENPFT